MYDELIKRLRNMATSDGNIKSNYIGLTLLQAADAIEELQLYVDLYKDLTEKGEKVARKVIDKYPRWIPVTKRLPEDRKMVLAAVNGVVCVAFYGNYMWEEAETYNIFYPTHWMPLPQPPKREGE